MDYAYQILIKTIDIDSITRLCIWAGLIWNRLADVESSWRATSGSRGMKGHHRQPGVFISVGETDKDYSLPMVGKVDRFQAMVLAVCLDRISIWLVEIEPPALVSRAWIMLPDGPFPILRVLVQHRNNSYASVSHWCWLEFVRRSDVDKQLWLVMGYFIWLSATLKAFVSACVLCVCLKIAELLKWAIELKTKSHRFSPFDDLRFRNYTRWVHHAWSLATVLLQSVLG